VSPPERSARHRSREVALQALFALDLQSARARGRSAQEGFDDVAENFELPEAARAFAKELVCGVAERRAALDGAIGGVARNWRVERMAVVDRNILRLGCYELSATDTPTAVVLDEAVKMARRFADDASPRFVNGVLDALARELRPRERHPRGSEGKEWG